MLSNYNKIPQKIVVHGNTCGMCCSASSFSSFYTRSILNQGLPTCGTRRSSRWYAINFHFFTKTWIHSFPVYAHFIQFAQI